MSPNSYEVEALREALRKTRLNLKTDDELEVALDMAKALEEQDYRLTSGGKNPSHDD